MIPRLTRGTREPSVRRAIVLGAGVFVLVFLVALGGSRLHNRVGGAGHVLSPSSILGDLDLLFAVFAVGMFGWMFYVFFSDRDKGARGKPERKSWKERLLKALVLLLIFGIIIGLRFLLHPKSRGSILGHMRIRINGRGTLAHLGAKSSGGAGGVHWWFWLGLLIVVVIGGAVAVLVSRRRRALRAEEQRYEAEPDDLRAAIERSLEELEHEPDPRRAVISAYIGMEQSLSRHGLARQPFETPLEYLGRALRVIHVSRGAGERLTALFERARFSERPVAFEMKRDAIAALTAVRDELAAGQPS
jgi:Domain of unknown function (DUF4129)